MKFAVTKDYWDGMKGFTLRADPYDPHFLELTKKEISQVKRAYTAFWKAHAFLHKKWQEAYPDE